MSLAEEASNVRERVIALCHALNGRVTLDKETEDAFCRLVFEMDRLGDRAETLAGARK